MKKSADECAQEELDAWMVYLIERFTYPQLEQVERWVMWLNKTMPEVAADWHNLFRTNSTGYQKHFETDDRITILACLLVVLWTGDEKAITETFAHADDPEDGGAGPSEGND